MSKPLRRVLPKGAALPTMPPQPTAGSERTRSAPGSEAAEGEPRAVPAAERAAARGDGVDAQHRRADARARDDRLVVALEAAGIMADVGRGAAHVEADQARLAQGCGAADHADDAPRGAGEDRIAAVEGGGGGEAARAFHEQIGRAHV